MGATPILGVPSLSASLETSPSERYEALIRVSQAIGAQRDPKDVFCAMARELHRVVRFDGIAVAHYDGESNEILWNICQVCSRQGPVAPPVVPADASITKWVFSRQEPLVVPSLDEEARFPQVVAFLRERAFNRCALCP